MFRGLSLCAALNVHWPERSGCGAVTGVAATKKTTAVVSLMVQLLEVESSSVMTDIRTRSG
jgi:hypothetical protein